MSKIVPAFLLALILPASASGEAVRVPCDRPFVFPDAALNVVVLPYSQPPSLPARNSKVGEQLGALVELEALLAIVKFRSVGFIQIVGDPGRGCTPEAVLDKLLGKAGGAAAEIRPKNALLMIWGRIFESGSDFYVQSYVSFLRRDVIESIKLDAGGKTLEGRLSSRSFACTARKMSLADLDEIQKQYATSALLRTTPDLVSAFVPIPEGAGPYSFWITEVRGDWVQLQAMAPNQGRVLKGWVQARPNQDQWALRKVMPEMALIEGIGGYLSARVTGQGTSTLDAAATALDAYLGGWRSGAIASNANPNETALAIAVPHQIRGFVALMRGTNADAALTLARERFERAVTLIPYSGDARNLAAMTRVALAFRQPAAAEAPRRFVDDLVTAAGADPANPDILANLATVYDLVLDAAPPAWQATPAEERQELDSQRRELRRLLATANRSANPPR